MYLKRNKIGKFWPVPRKGTKYLAVPSHNKNESVPLIVVMRDILKLVKTKKELKKVLNEKKIQINYKEIREVNYPVCLFDIVSIPKIDKYYRVLLSKFKKITLEEISEKDAKTKVFKVINKKILLGKKIQLNLMHGINMISNEKVNTKDSIVLDLKEKKIVKIIPLEKGKNVFVIKGKHIGKKGKIEEIIKEGGKEIVKITFDNEKINVWTRNIILIE